MWTNPEAAAQYFQNWKEANPTDRQNSLIYQGPDKKSTWYFLTDEESGLFIMQLAKAYDSYLYNDAAPPVLQICLAMQAGIMKPLLVITRQLIYGKNSLNSCDPGQMDFSKAMLMTRPVDFGQHITNETEKEFTLKYDETDNSNLDSVFMINEGACAGKVVTYYTFTLEDIAEVIITHSSFAASRLTISMGASEKDETWDHPVEFRPILGVEATLDIPGSDSNESYYWDYSNPCPPNCAPR